MTQITFDQGLESVADLVKRFSRPCHAGAGGQGRGTAGHGQSRGRAGGDQRLDGAISQNRQGCAPPQKAGAGKDRRHRAHDQDRGSTCRTQEGRRDSRGQQSIDHV